MAVYCNRCGTALPHSARFCSSCGTVISAAPPMPGRPLVRPIAGRQIAGVCIGLAQAYGWDVAVVRVVDHFHSEGDGSAGEPLHDVQVLRALRAGARGYILKGHVHRELLETIRAVHAGQKRIPPEVAAGLADHAADDDLTAREIDVLRLIACGNANKVIAAQLFITEETVKSHVTNILSKLGANDRTHAVTIGLKRGIIEL